MTTSSLRSTSKERLDNLPEVFSVEELRAGQRLSVKAASVYLARWKAKGLISRLGPRCGLWVNLQRAGTIAPEHRREAIRRKYPEYLVGGASALAEAGWRPYSGPLTVLVPQGISRVQLDGVDIQPRPHKVFFRLEDAALDRGALPPAVALMDWMIADKHFPREDFTAEQIQQAHSAAQTLGLDALLPSFKKD